MILILVCILNLSDRRYVPLRSWLTDCYLMKLKYHMYSEVSGNKGEQTFNVIPNPSLTIHISVRVLGPHTS